MSKKKSAAFTATVSAGPMHFAMSFKADDLKSTERVRGWNVRFWPIATPALTQSGFGDAINFLLQPGRFLPAIGVASLGYYCVISKSTRRNMPNAVKENPDRGAADFVGFVQDILKNRKVACCL
jgi:hypothetical protein